MGRQWIETAEDWPPPEIDRLYQGRIGKPERCKDMKGLSVRFEFVDEEQAGRIHLQFLSLPIRPQGLTALFFAACGMDVSVGCRVRPKDTEGMIVGARFAWDAGRNEWQIVGFERWPAASEAEVKPDSASDNDEQD